MAFFKFRNRGSQGNEGRSASVASPPAESVEAMRRRARHRLLGAAVLVLVGVIGFPLLFDTQPRPVSVDIPIEIPDRNKVKPLVVPTAPGPTSSTPSTAPPTVAADGNGNGSSNGHGSSGTRVAAASPSSAMITEAADGSEISASKPVTTAPPARLEPRQEVKAEAKPETRPETKPEHKAEPKPKPEAKAEAKPKPEPKPEARTEAKPEPKPKPTEVKAASSEDGARARALLEGKVASSGTAPAAAAVTAKPATASDEAGRFVVQVGAFADASKAREVRQKLESAGLKTYTHVAKTADGERTRVRVGPFATRADADRAAGRVKSLSLSASVLTL
ncbi:MAG: sporulation protein [Variovorax sp.]|nr:sporulation protein [Variovorax sp.]